jgi:hypothetical protein
MAHFEVLPFTQGTLLRKGAAASERAIGKLTHNESRSRITLSRKS